MRDVATPPRNQNFQRRKQQLCRKQPDMDLRDTKRRRTEFAAAPARRRGVPCRRCSRSFKHSHCGHCNRAFKNPETCQ